MSKKYDFNNNQEEIAEPSIVRINKDQVSIIHASSTDVTEIPDDEELIIQIGNIESYNPSTLSPEPEPENIPNNNGGNNSSQGNGSENGGGSESGSSTVPIINGDTVTIGNKTYGTVHVNIQNDTGSEIRLYGEMLICASRTPSNWNNAIQISADFIRPHNPDWYSYPNTVSIGIGQSCSINCLVETKYLDGTYYLMEGQSASDYVTPVWLYSVYYNTRDNTVNWGQALYHIEKNEIRQQLSNGATIYVTADRLKLSDESPRVTDTTVAISGTTTEVNNLPNTIHYVVLPIGEKTLL